MRSLLLLAVLLCTPLSAPAAMIVPRISSAPVLEGETVSVSYMLVPGDGETVYTVGFSGEFPTELLSLTSFSFAQPWIVVPQPGHDEVDDVHGTFRKTAGYPGGTDSETLVGTATFLVNSAGRAEFAVGADSLAYDRTHRNLFANAALPAQLFDIRLLVERPNIVRLADAVAHVTFESFGRVPTPVLVTLVVLREDGSEVYRAEEVVTVQTEAVFMKRFLDAPDVPDGRYTLRVHTLYNETVRDTFDMPLVVAPETATSRWIFWGVGTLTCLIFALLFLLWQRKTERTEQERKTGMRTALS